MYIRSYCFTRSSGLQKYLQSWKLIVQNQLFREHGLMNKFSSTGKITDVFRTVTVTGEQQRQMIFAAAAENLITVFSGITTVAIWSQGSFVNFKDCSGFSGSSGKNIIIYRIMGVVAVTEDFDTGILHDIDKSFCVLVSGTWNYRPGTRGLFAVT